jgi:translation initiation factor 5
VQNIKGTVNGAHQSSDLQELLFSFIRKFVLCPSCNLPETALTVKKSGQVWHKCSACGHKGAVVDGSHRLNVFIVKEAEQGAKDKKDKKDKKEKKEKTEKSDKKEKKEKKDKKEKKSKRVGSSAAGAAAGAGGGAGGDDAGHDDVELVGDGDEAQADMEDVVATADTLVVDDVAAIESAAEAVQVFLAGSTGVSTPPTDVASKVMEVCTNCALPATDRVAVYAAAVLGDSVLTQSGDAGVLACLLAVMHTCGSAKGFDLSQQALLVALERLLGAEAEAKPWLLAATPLVLLNLYKAKALWEDQVLVWAAAERSGPHGAVVAAAAPMLKWLESAEVEEPEVAPDAASAREEEEA